MSERSQHFYEFGRFRINIGERVLLRDHEIVQLTPKVFDILLALVENSGQVISKDGLMKKVWPDSFVEEGNLTQNISLLRKALGEGRNGNQYIETVARRGYRFVASVSESWDQGIDLVSGQYRHGEAPVVEPVSAASRRDVAMVPAHGGVVEYVTTGAVRHRQAVFVFLLVLVFAAAGMIYFVNGSKSVDGSSTAIESIAVLPFVNEASDSDAEYFTDEITESLINNLSQLPKLRVVPRSVVLNYKGRESDPRKIGRDLNVRAVLTGRVHRRGDTLSIQVDLIDVANVAQMWGQHYDHRVSDILLVQEDISRDIFENLRLKLSVEEQKQLEAHSLYLKGRNYWNKRTEDGLLQGIEYFRKAIELDQNYAPAYAGLADCYNMLVVYGINQPREAFPKAKEAATKALSIDGTLAEARTSLAFIEHRWDWAREEAERDFRLAIKYKPTYAPAHQWYSSYLVAMGRFDEAIAEAKRAEELEPLSFISNSHLGWILYLAGRNDEAIEHCKRLLDVDPNFFPARRYLGLAYEQKGAYNEAIDQFQQGVKLSGSPLMLSLLGHAYAVSGKKAEAQRILAELDQQKQRYVSPYTIATIYAGLGEKDQAFKWLEKAYEDRDIWLMNLDVDPVLKNLKLDRRFASLLERIGLTP
ncbi:MAG TPA: winged helix-turn-helix domain-containing protein [Blastocatellia bacterium]|nr:winged helix-turn-helix domain-containing protein [Blastocatellia bacterium]